jgi:xanthine dehydrogenase YagR molybdenum-binding subunit
VSAAQSPVGAPVSRVDGRLKVTGEARYAAEFDAPDLAQAWVVSAAIARGRITRLDASAALAVPGVLAVFTHQNRPHLPWFDRSYRDDDSPAGSPFRPLYDDRVHFGGQPVALVVAGSLDVARHAASLVVVEYAAEPVETDLAAARGRARQPKLGKLGYSRPKGRGDADAALARAAVVVTAEFECPIEHHNPMETHATTVVVEADRTLTVFDKTQGVLNTQNYLTRVFGLSKDDLRVRSPFVGGAFGSGLRPQYQAPLAVMAARELGRSVRVVLTRQQMFTFGHRPATLHTVRLGATADGRLEAIAHEAVGETSRHEDYTENVVGWSGTLYHCDHVKLSHDVVDLDYATPLDMRAPGAAWGLFALESALDELAAATGVDPLELRLRNYAERDESADRPFSSKELRACYHQGAARFGWEKRSPAPRSMREGHALVGYGMATGMWDAGHVPARARAVLTADGRLLVQSATSDIGTGTYTIMAQVAAATLGLAVEAVRAELGDSVMPFAPLQGGSWTAASVGSAVKAVCEAVADKVFALARKAPGSALAKAERAEVVFADGHVRLASDPSQAVSIAEAMGAGGVASVEETTTSVPDAKAMLKYTRATHSAVFVEVHVDEALGTARVKRVVSAVAAGRILNPKTARSQVSGAVVWGLGMALTEESLVDHALGRIVNHSLAEYHVPVNADVPDVDVIFVEEHDAEVNPLGAKGVGEIGILGVAAAVANAVFHATGRRVRSLPITLDKLL